MHARRAGPKSNPETIFIKLPGQKTYPLALDLTKETVSDLKRLIYAKLDIKSETAEIMLSHQGRSVLSSENATLAEAKIKAGSAIHVSLPLIGGVQADDPIPANHLRIEACAKGNEDVILHRADIEVNFDTTLMSYAFAKFLGKMPDEHKIYHWFVHKIADAAPKPQLDNQAVQTLRQAGGIFFKKKPRLVIIGLPQQVQPELRQSSQSFRKTQSSFGSGGAAQSDDNRGLDNFLMKMKVKGIDAALGAQIKQILQPEQKKKLCNFIKTVDDDESFILQLMSTLNQAQVNDALYSLQEYINLPEEVLQNQKTHIFVEGCSAMEDSYFGIKEILAKPRSFNIERPMDISIGKSIAQKQKICNCLQLIMKALSPRDWRSIFLVNLNDRQVAQLFLEMLKKNDSPRAFKEADQDNVSHHLFNGSPFWECLNKDRRFRIWNQLPERYQVDMLCNSNINFITAKQRLALWNDFDDENRSNAWCKLQSRQATELLKLLPRLDQQKLWMSSKPELQINLLELMQDQKLKAYCWNQTSQKTQSKIIKLKERDEIDQMVLENFFGTLNDHDLCFTANLHHKHTETYKIFKQCVPEGKQKIIDYYIEYGTVIGNKLISNVKENKKDKKAKEDLKVQDKFMQELKDEEFDAYQNIPLYDQPKSYVQVMANPKVKNGFITVEDVKNLPVKVDNSKYENKMMNSGEDFVGNSTNIPTELETNTVLRLIDQDTFHNENETKYYTMKEVEIDPNRNVKFFSVISYWEYTQEAGFWCTHSFVAPNRISLLIEGHKGEVFFFSQHVDPERHSLDSKQHIYVNILNLERPNMTGEEARKILNNCVSHRVQQDGHLHHYLARVGLAAKIDDSNDDQIEEQIFSGRTDLTQVNKTDEYNGAILKRQKLEKDDLEDQDVIEHYWLTDPTIVANGKYLVYNGGSEADGSTLHLYHLANRCTVATIEKVEALIDSYENEQSGDLHLLCYRSNSNIDQKPKKPTDEEIEANEDEDLDLEQAYEENFENFEYGYRTEIVEIKINLQKLEQHSEQMRHKGEDSTKEQEAEISKQEVILASFTDLESFGGEDGEGVYEWSLRYKNNPSMRTIIQRSESDDKFASTFSLIVKPNADHPCSYTFKLTQQGNNLACKATHFVWNTRQVVQQAKIEGEERKVFVSQKSEKQVQLIDITQVPEEIVKLPIELFKVDGTQKNQETTPEVDQVLDNMYQYRFISQRTIDDEKNKYEHTRWPWFEALVLEKSMVGGVIHEDGALEWFEEDLTKTKAVQVVPKKLKKRKVFVRYPWFVYTGLFPDNRELVMANLADDDLPQTIIHIDGQLINFFGYDGRNRIEYLNFEIENKQPIFTTKRITRKHLFKRAQIGDVSDIQIVRGALKGKPKSFDIRKVKRAEMVEAYGGAPAMICQTEQGIYWLKPLTKDTVEIPLSSEYNEIDLPMRRGNLQYFFWIETIPLVQERIVCAVRCNPKKDEPDKIPSFKFADAEFIQFEVSRSNSKEHEKHNINLQLVDTQEQVHMMEFNLKRKVFEQRNDEPTSIEHSLKIEWEKLQIDDKEKAGRKLYRQFQDNRRCYSFVNDKCIRIKLEDTVIYRQTETDQTYVVCSSNDDFRKWMSEKVGEYQIKNKKKQKYMTQILWEKRVGSGHYNRRMLEVSSEITDKDGKSKSHRRSTLVTIPNPDSKMNDIAVSTDAHKVKQVQYICKDKLLFGFEQIYFDTMGRQTDKPSSFYWSVLFKNGQIDNVIPFDTAGYTDAQVYPLQSENSCLILRNTDEFQVVKLDHLGNPLAHRKFSEQQIRSDLMIKLGLGPEANNLERGDNQEMEQTDRQMFDSEGSTSNFSLQPKIMVTRKGELYRIATVVSHNLEARRINEKKHMHYNDPNRSIGGKCPLYGTYFRAFEFGDNRKKPLVLKVLIFECASEQEQEEFFKQSSTLCGEFFCYWSLADRSKINVIKTQGNLTFQGDSIDECMWSKQDMPSLDDTPRLNMQVPSDTKVYNESQLLLNGSIDDNVAQQEVDKSFEGILWKRVDEYVKTHQIKTDNLGLDLEKEKMQIILEALEDKTRSHTYLMQDYLWACRRDDLSKPESLLQVSMEGKTLIYDIAQWSKPNDVTVVYDTELFFDPTTFLDTGFSNLWTPREKSRWNHLQANQDHSLFVIWDKSQKQMGKVEDKKKQHALNQSIRSLRSIKTTEKLDNVETHYQNIENAEQKQKDYLKALDKFTGLIKPFSLMELYGLNCVVHKLQSYKPSKGLNLVPGELESFLTIYKDRNVFEIVEAQKKVAIPEILKLVEQQLDIVAKDESSVLGETILDTPLIRRLYRILKMPTIKDPNEGKSAEDEEGEGDVSPRNQATYLKKLEPSITKKIRDIKQKDIYEKLKQQSEVKGGAVFQNQLKDHCLNYVTLSIRDQFLKLAQYSSEFTILDCTNDQDDLGIMLQDYTSTLHSFLEATLQSNKTTQSITEVRWNPDSDIDLITFTRDSQIVNEDDVQPYIDQKLKAEDRDLLDASMKYTPVEVTVLDIGWLLSDCKSFMSFSITLQDTKGLGIYQSQFLSVLVDQFWDKYSGMIIYQCMVPWIFYLLCNIYFTTTVLQDGFADRGDILDFTFKKFLVALMSLLVIWLITVEYLQMKGTSFMVHFGDKHNWIDLLQLGLTAYLVVIHYTSSDLVIQDRLSQRIVAIFSMFFLWAKFFEWLELFSSTSFYVRLVIETVYDVLPFLRIFFISLLWFGSALWILEINQTSDADEDAVIGSTFGYFIIDKFYNQYMLSLGEFALDGYEKHPQSFLCHIFFILATVFTQLIIFNMMIAIMGDTFGKIMESRDIYALKTKLSSMSKYCNVISTGREEQNYSNYLFIVRRKPDEGSSMQDPESWSGSLTFLTKVVRSETANLKQAIRKNTNDLKQGMRQVKTDQAIKTLGKRFSDNNDFLREQIQNIQKDLKEMKMNQKQEKNE